MAKSTADRDRERREAMEESKIVTRIERASGPVHIPDQGAAVHPNHLYNIGGNLVWNGVDLTAAAQGRIAQATTLGGLSDVSADGAKSGYVLTKMDGGWIATAIGDLIKIRHSHTTDLDGDDHRQYLTAERHGEIDHSISALSVAEGRLVASAEGVSISGDLSLTGRSGILVAQGGRVIGNATTDDLPEGDRVYHTSERVTTVGDGRYLLLDGSNLGALSVDGRVLVGFDADMVDGVHASGLAGVEHGHTHSELTALGPNDHHPESHGLTGPQHSFPSGVTPGSVLSVGVDGLVFSQIDLSTTSGSLPLSRVGPGNIGTAEFEALAGATGNLQAQVDRKSDGSHTHAHDSLSGTDLDQHTQYLTVERADEWLDGKTADDIRGGDTNTYFDPDAVSIVGDTLYLRRDGSNHPTGAVGGLDADMVDGIHGDELAPATHGHQHSSLDGIGADDHHPRLHGIGEHTLPAGAVGFPRIIDGELQFGDLSPTDLPPGLASEDAVRYLADVVIAQRDLIDSKVDGTHRHSHSSLSDPGMDDHEQYLTRDRALALIGSLSSDSIHEGTTNRYFDPRLARDAITPTAPLGYGEDGQLTLAIDETRLAIIDGRLTIRRQDDAGLVIADTLSIGKTLLLANNDMIIVGDEDAPADLLVSGTVRANSLALPSGNGIVSAADGTLVAGAPLGMLADVNTQAATRGQVLSYDGLLWHPVAPSSLDLGLPEGMTRADVIDIHGSLSHDIPDLRVGQGLLSVDPIRGSVAIGVMIGINGLDVNGGVAIGRQFAGSVVVDPGNLAVSDRIGVGTPSPRTALDLGAGTIVGGTHSADRPNVLDLSSNAETPTVAVAFDGGSFELSVADAIAALRLNTGAAGSVALLHSGADGTRVTVPETLAINVGGIRRASFTAGGLGVGINDPRAAVDVRGTIGVSDGGSNPTNWMMLRSVAPGAPPSICFPHGGSLRIGTLRSYDAGSVWDEMANLEGGDLSITGRFRGGVHSATLAEGDNDDVQTRGGTVLRLVATDGSSIGGMTDGIDGMTLTMLNGGEADIGLINEAIGSAPENRIRVAPSDIIPARSARVFIYDGNGKRWIPII